MVLLLVLYKKIRIYQTMELLKNIFLCRRSLKTLLSHNKIESIQSKIDNAFGCYCIGIFHLLLWKLAYNIRIKFIKWTHIQSIKDIDIDQHKYFSFNKSWLSSLYYKFTNLFYILIQSIQDHMYIHQVVYMYHDHIVVYKQLWYG